MKSQGHLQRDKSLVISGQTMGVCLCKDKIVEGQNDSNADHNGQLDPFHVRKVQIRWLADTVDELVTETLHVIGSIVDK